MPGSETAEIYFIAAMMILIFIISFAAVFFFFRQYRKEMKGKDRNDLRGNESTESANSGNDKSK